MKFPFGGSCGVFNEDIILSMWKLGTSYKLYMEYKSKWGLLTKIIYKILNWWFETQNTWKNLKLHGFFVCIKCPYPSNHDGKKKIRFFFSCCNLHVKFKKITSGFTLTERWKAGNYHINFWSMTLKAEFYSSERPVLFLFICSIFLWNMVARCVGAM